MRFFILLLLFCACFALCEDRFPKPEFENGHSIPSPTEPMPRSSLWQYTDIGVLFLSLSLASYLALKIRSRKAVFLLSLFCLGYFGFYKKGCICPIGAIQNISLSLFDMQFALPIAALIIFFLPLVYALLFGRMFCSCVCPLGVLQDLFAIKPLEIKRWVALPLRLLAYLYLGLAILLSSTGSAFIICQYDPFVAFFRFSGKPEIILLGIAFLLTGIFLARPYCRFFCPYGVLLGWLSRISFWHVNITPQDCISCRLCEKTCPFGSILPPTEEKPKESRSQGIYRLAMLFLLLPFLVFLGSWSIGKLYIPLSKMHRTVSLAERIHAEESGKKAGTILESKTFRSLGKTNEALYQEAMGIRYQFFIGTHILAWGRAAGGRCRRLRRRLRTARAVPRWA